MADEIGGVLLFRPQTKTDSIDLPEILLNGVLETYILSKHAMDFGSILCRSLRRSLQKDGNGESCYAIHGNVLFKITLTIKFSIW